MQSELEQQEKYAVLSSHLKSKPLPFKQVSRPASYVEKPGPELAQEAETLLRLSKVATAAKRIRVVNCMSDLIMWKSMKIVCRYFCRPAKKMFD